VSRELRPTSVSQSAEAVKAATTRRCKMDLQQTVPPTFNNLFQTAHGHPLQRSQSAQNPVASIPPHFHALNAGQQNNGFVQQRYLQQRALTAAGTAHRPPPYAPQPTQQFLSASDSVPVQSHVVPHPSQHSYTLSVHHGLPIQSIPGPQTQSINNQIPAVQDVRQDPVPPEHASKPDANLEGLKLVPDPPRLEAWRKRLFNVDGMIILSEEE
jgi:hypothetical protein